MDRYYPLSPEVAGQGTIGNPSSFAAITENAWLVDVEIIIPSGHVGLTGIRVMQSGQQIIPWGNLSWITGDNYQRVFAVNTEIGARSLSVQAYNTDFFAHTFHVRFHLRDLDDIRGEPVTALPGTIQDILDLTSGPFA